MYSNEKSVQILIALLKEKNIKHVILSPGGSDAPIIRSFEYDDHFICYSVVDERNAAYFAMGIAIETDSPVICVCTAGTAVSNYLPGITEAFYQGIPLIAITADGDPYLIDQLELQKIEQSHIFDCVTKRSVTLPIVEDEMDEWFCNRVVNEALLEIDRFGIGPVHINVPITRTLECSQTTIPKQRVIRRTDLNKIDAEFYIKRLMGKKIMVIIGQNSHIASDDIYLLDRFFDQFDCFFSIETVSNLVCKGAIQTYPITETRYASGDKGLLPDIVISIGKHVASYRLKELLRNAHEHIENWLITESGEVKDPYYCLKEIFVGTYKDFFEVMVDKLPLSRSSHKYHDAWYRAHQNIKLDDLEYSSLSVAEILSKTIPNGSLLHTAILNSTRIMQFFDQKDNVRYHSNLGALGIDGCVATFMGQANATDDLAYLLVGDLSFFYGMNGLSIKGFKNNIRIILLNNGGGEEFKIKMDYKDMDRFICARCDRTAKGWVESLGFEYFTASSNDEVALILERFQKYSDKPLFLELFFDIDRDSQIIKKIYQENEKRINGVMRDAMDLICRSLPSKYRSKAKRILQVVRK